MKKHEWVKGWDFFVTVCSHCETRRIERQNRKGFSYKVYGQIDNISFEEPECIERTEKEDGQNDKA